MVQFVHLCACHIKKTGVLCTDTENRFLLIWLFKNTEKYDSNLNCDKIRICIVKNRDFPKMIFKSQNFRMAFYLYEHNKIMHFMFHKYSFVEIFLLEFSLCCIVKNFFYFLCSFFRFFKIDR